MRRIIASLLLAVIISGCSEGASKGSGAIADQTSQPDLNPSFDLAITPGVAENCDARGEGVDLHGCVVRFEWQDGWYRNVNLSGADLSGSNFHNDLFDNTYQEHYQAECDWFNREPTYSTPTPEMFYEFPYKRRSGIFDDPNFANANLTGAILHEVSMRDADFINADLSGIYGCRLSIQGDFSGSLLRHADLRDAKLCDSSFRAADLTYADLRLACLVGVDATGANFTRANLERANLNGYEGQVKLVGANLSYARLVDADLYNADLTDATLDYADLSGANLLGVNLTNVDLSTVNLSGATMPDGTIHP